MLDTAFEFVHNHIEDKFMEQQSSSDSPAIIRTAKFLPILKLLGSYLQAPENYVLQESHNNESAKELMYFIYDTSLDE